jgi:hypothetical protein
MRRGAAGQKFNRSAKPARPRGPRTSYAVDYSPLNAPATIASAAQNTSGHNVGGSFIENWLAMVSATQAAQPHWMTPLVTVTPRLEQEFRFDENIMNQGNGSHILNVGGGEGIEVIPTYNTELIFGVPAYDDVTTAKGANPTGWADYPALLFKYRPLSANEQQGNYIVTAFLQTSVPTGFNTISNDVYVVQPTLASAWDGAISTFRQPSASNMRFRPSVLPGLCRRSAIRFWPTWRSNIISSNISGRNLRSFIPIGRAAPMPTSVRCCRRRV